MKRGLITTIFTTTCLILALGAFQVSAQENADANTNVLNINGTMISQDQFNRELVNELNKDAGKTLTEDEVKAKLEKVIEKIIRNELLYQECEKDNIVVSEEEINEKLDAEKSKFATPEEYQQSLKNSNMDESIRRNEIKRNLAIQHLINDKFKPTITDKEVDKYYNDNPDKYKDMTEDQAKEAIKKQLGREKIADSYNKFYVEIKNKAKIESFLK